MDHVLGAKLLNPHNIVDTRKRIESRDSFIKESAQPYPAREIEISSPHAFIHSHAANKIWIGRSGSGSFACLFDKGIMLYAKGCKSCQQKRCYELH